MIKSTYIHIPFCKTICSYCDFCKFYYQKQWINSYLKSLSKEIDSLYSNEIMDTIYIGGGTPNSLSNDELISLFEILSKINKGKNYEYTIECNIEYITKSQLEIFKKYGVNRLSIGVQTLNNNLLKELNRNHTKEEVLNKINLAKKMGFNNINIDLMYGLPGETLSDIKEDLDFIIKLDIPHISTYSLMLEEHTMFYINNIKNIDEDLEVDMYNLIRKTLKDNNYNHYEISNFAKTGCESKHNLTYWNNNEYYGFGLNASSYINNERITNTSILNKYMNNDYQKVIEEINYNSKLEYEFILGFRKIKGINKLEFYKKYHRNLEDIKVVKELINEGKLTDDKENIFINSKYIYTENDILVRFIGENYEE